MTFILRSVWKSWFDIFLHRPLEETRLVCLMREQCAESIPLLCMESQEREKTEKAKENLKKETLLNTLQKPGIKDCLCLGPIPRGVDLIFHSWGHGKTSRHIHEQILLFQSAYPNWTNSTKDEKHYPPPSFMVQSFVRTTPHMTPFESCDLWRSRDVYILLEVARWKKNVLHPLSGHPYRASGRKRGGVKGPPEKSHLCFMAQVEGLLWVDRLALALLTLSLADLRAGDVGRMKRLSSMNMGMHTDGWKGHSKSPAILGNGWSGHCWYKRQLSG